MPAILRRVMDRTGPSRVHARGWWEAYKANFSNHPERDALAYMILLLVFFMYCCVALFENLLVNRYITCDLPPDEREYQNVLYDSNPCLEVRYAILLLLTRREAEHLRRVLLSLALGSLIGYERRSPDRPAGIRTMSVTALGACTFTLASMFAFVTGPMAWDASRISASIPSGCGFLGAGLIWKGFVKARDPHIEDTHQVHGLTTAASIWLSAAVGVAAGGGMYFVASFTTLSIILMLRFGPRNSDMAHEDHDHHEDAYVGCDDGGKGPTDRAADAHSVADGGLTEPLLSRASLALAIAQKEREFDSNDVTRALMDEPGHDGAAPAAAAAAAAAGEAAAADRNMRFHNEALHSCFEPASEAMPIDVEAGVGNAPLRPSVQGQPPARSPCGMSEASAGRLSAADVAGTPHTELVSQSSTRQRRNVKPSRKPSLMAT